LSHDSAIDSGAIRSIASINVRTVWLIERLRARILCEYHLVMRPVRRACHAKINLALGVGPPDESRQGMHPIASWMHAVGLADEVAIEPRQAGAGSTFDIEWAPDAPRPTPIDWPIERDLAARAHALLERHVGRPLDVRVTITKRIPVGAGLGGGSADAAGALLALVEAFDLNLDVGSLRALSAELGSDIAFFIDDASPTRPALVTGFADRIERISPRTDPVILIIPHVSCPTGEVYRAYDALGPSPLDEQRVRAIVAYARTDALFNDLAAAAEQVQPHIREVRAVASRALDAPVHVTGSGSAMFAFGAERQARLLAGAFAAIDPTPVIVRTALVATPTR
jgi:4-diphosphocytidyl-2-C-methyl-D-erythritol kinase